VESVHTGIYLLMTCRLRLNADPRLMVVFFYLLVVDIKWCSIQRGIRGCFRMDSARVIAVELFSFVLHPRKRHVQGRYFSMSKWRVHFFVSSV